MTDLDVRAGSRAHRARRGRTGRGCLAVLIALVVVLVLVGGLLWRGANVVGDLFDGADPVADYSGPGRGPVRVEVVEGDTATDIGATLERAGVVASVEAFAAAAAADSRSTGIQPGFYQLREKMAAAAALQALIETRPILGSEVTVPEGLTVDETLARLAGETSISRGALDRAAADIRALDLPAYARGELEGYLFPSTYPIDKQDTAPDVLAVMVGQFKQEAAELSLPDRAANGNISPTQAVIVASLVQAEASRPADFGKVARVVYNRLDDGMPLEFDSTVNYFTESPGFYTTDEERATPSPYNTYLNPGLPPTPIEAPGAAALGAALKPTPGDWTFFVTINPATGRTLFAENYDEHLSNVEIRDEFCASSDLC